MMQTLRTNMCSIQLARGKDLQEERENFPFVDMCVFGETDMVHSLLLGTACFS